MPPEHQAAARPPPSAAWAKRPARDGGDRRAVFREHRKESRAAFGFVRGEFDRAREHDGFEGGREFFRIGLDVGRDDEGRGAGLLQGFPFGPRLAAVKIEIVARDGVGDRNRVERSFVVRIGERSPLAAGEHLAGVFFGERAVGAAQSFAEHFSVL